MKKNLISLGLMLAAAFTLTNCAKQEVITDNEETLKPVTFTITAGVNTKTSVEDEDAAVINWVAGDALNVFYAESGATEYGTNHQFTTSDGSTTFTTTDEISLTADAYDWYVLYPYDSHITTPANTGSGYLGIGSADCNTPQVQQGNNSRAHLAGRYFPLCGIAEAVAKDEQPQISLFQTLSVAKVVVTNNSNNPVTVSSISFTAPEDICGTYYIDFSGGSAVFKSSGDNFVSKTARLSVQDGEAIDPNESAEFYIAFKPFEAQSGDDLTLNVNGQEKTITLTGNVPFKEGAIRTFNFEYTGADYDFTTIAELNAQLTSESASYSGYLADAVVSFVPATNTAFIRDATGSIMLYKGNHGLKQGQTFTGALEVTAVLYHDKSGNALYSEITLMSASFTGGETAVDPEDIELSDLIDNYDVYQNAYVKVADLTVSEVSGKNITVTDGKNNYIVYTNWGNATNAAGQIITVVGTVTKYGTTEEIKVWKAADITVNSPVINVTSANPMPVANTADSYEIEYTIENPATATLTASTEATWISNLVYSNEGSVTFDVAAQETDAPARSAQITLSYEGAADVTVTVNQAAGPSSGGGSGPEVGTVMWAETWQGGTAGETPADYGQEGTTVYNSGIVTYTNGGIATKLYDDTMATTNLLLAKSANSGWWNISGIPTGGASSLTLSFETNNSAKSRYAISTTTEGVSLGDLSVSGSSSPYTVTATITITGTVDTFDLKFANGTTSNVRLDNLSIVVAD